MARPPRIGLSELPTEILDQIVSCLGRQTLIQFCMVAKFSCVLTLPLIWREVDLVDCVTRAYRTGPGKVIEDKHDDGPIIRKLLVLATNNRVAQCVQILNHRCHQSLPSVFDELLDATFAGQAVSYDPRLIRLVRLAVDNLVNLHTLRIIHGHPRLIEALVRSLFDRRRIKSTPVRRLWLESCALAAPLQAELSGSRHGLATNLDFGGLTSLRVRRLKMSLSPQDYRNAYPSIAFQRTVDEQIDTTSEWAIGASEYSQLGDEVVLREKLNDYYKLWNQLDDEIFDAIAKDIVLPKEVQRAAINSHMDRAIWAYCIERVWPTSEVVEAVHRTFSPAVQAVFCAERPSSAASTLNVLRQCQETLTSLTLDWVDMGTEFMRSKHDYQLLRQAWYRDVFRLRFPHLRAFQFRNCTTSETRLPDNIFLLDYCWPLQPTDSAAAPDVQHDSWAPLSFMEAHPKLQCLAWPMDRFFDCTDNGAPTDRVGRVMDNLAANLKDLRVDTLMTGEREPLTEPASGLATASALRARRRRRFIERCAPRLYTVEHIKVSGSVPLDERREILRALYRCPLQRISLIGVSSSMGNTWSMPELDAGTDESPSEQDIGAIWRLGSTTPSRPDGEFVAAYGWAGAAPMVSTIAGYFGETLRAVKLCGYAGAPELLNPSPITTPMLSGLKYLDHLEDLVISLWIDTFFEGAQRDDTIIEFWQSIQDPSTTALAVVDQPLEERSTWQERIAALEPRNMADKVTALFAPLLSERAKQKGVSIRASFAVGDGTLFDLDVHVGKDDTGKDACLDFLGPREEFERERRRVKLATRRWF